MKKEIYTCDRCKKDVEKSDLSYCAVGVVSPSYGSCGQQAYNFLNDQLYRKKDLCRTCLDELGIVLPEKEKKKPEPEKYPTLDELIREMIREEIQQ
jgi:hypothetical protein